MDTNRVKLGLFTGPQAEPAFWAAQPLLVEVLKRGSNMWSEEAILQAIVGGDKGIILAYDFAAQKVEAFLVFSIQTTGAVKQMHLDLSGGDLSVMVDKMDDVEDWARQYGCTQIALAGRRGWVRALKDKGFRELYTVCVKQLGSIH